MRSRWHPAPVRLAATRCPALSISTGCVRRFAGRNSHSPVPPDHQTPKTPKAFRGRHRRVRVGQQSMRPSNRLPGSWCSVVRRTYGRAVARRRSGCFVKRPLRSQRLLESGRHYGRRRTAIAVPRQPYGVVLTCKVLHGAHSDECVV